MPVVPVAAGRGRDGARAPPRGWPVPPIIVTEIGEKHDAYAAAAAALTKSGTSTLELALAGVPMAVTYRVNPMTAAIARRLIRVPHVAMVNLLAGPRGGAGAAAERLHAGTPGRDGAPPDRGAGAWRRRSARRSAGPGEPAPRRPARRPRRRPRRC